VVECCFDTSTHVWGGLANGSAWHSDGGQRRRRLCKMKEGDDSFDGPSWARVGQMAWRHGPTPERMGAGYKKEWAMGCRNPFQI
jgi:hypothetical protein